MAKAKNVCPCFKCGEWFPTLGALKAHTCGVKPEAKKVEDKKEIKEEPVVETGETTEEEIKETTDFNRDDAINALKEAGIITDKRSVTRKSDEEVQEMLKEIEA